MTLPADPARSLPLLPEAVTSFGAATLGHHLYVCGGHRGERHVYSAPQVSGAFHRLDLCAGTAWESLPAAPPAQGAPLVAWNGRIIRTGGMAARNEPGQPNDLHSRTAVECFDPASGHWENLIAFPEPRSSHDAAVVGTTLYVAGGWRLSGPMRGAWFDELWSLDLADPGARWRVRPQPFRRRALAVAALGDRLYCLGGIDDEGHPSVAVHVFDTRTETWVPGPDLPTGPMNGFGCSAFAQAGRLQCSGMKGDLLTLDASGTRWEVTGRLEHPRFVHRLVPAGHRSVVIAGGEDGEGKRRDLEVLRVDDAP